MSNPFKKFVTQILQFSRSDRNALLILSALIIIALIVKVVVSNIEPKLYSDTSDFIEMVTEWERSSQNNSTIRYSLFSFNPNTIAENQLDSLFIPSTVKQNLSRYRSAGGKFYSARDLLKVYGMNDSILNAIEPFLEFGEIVAVNPTKSLKVKKNISGYFDPNKVELDELKNFGFNNFQATNLLKYRNKGGVFLNSSDLLKLYGIDSVFFEMIKNHVQIEIQNDFPIKEPPPDNFRVELNTADSLELLKLNGIGPIYAGRILKYRNLLGGYYSKDQLREVYNLSEETFQLIHDFVTVDTVSIKKIRINFAQYKDLLKHPYLDKNQVEALLSYKNKNGSFNKFSEIQGIKNIDSLKIINMKPYFSFR